MVVGGVTPKYNVLVFPGGTEIGLEIHAALSQCKEVRLFSAGLDASNHAPYVFAHHATLPSIHQPGWLEALNALVLRWDITHILPAYDDIIVALSKEREAIQSRLVTSPHQTCVITRSKSLTYECLRDVIRVPKAYRDVESISSFPVFVKPDAGQGSEGAELVHNRERLQAILHARANMLVMEYLPGEEYTVDCFSDRERGLLFCQARIRTRTRAGISMHTSQKRDERVRAIAEAISGRLELHGAWFFQLKQDRDGQLVLLEVAPRIAGTMALHRVLGVNFPLLSIYEHERIPVTLVTNQAAVCLDRALINCYKHDLNYGVVYVDLDDTLLFRGLVNTLLVRFLFQCINQGVRLVLLTRHAADVQQTLTRMRLRDVFDEVIVLGTTESKADYIREADAVLIDDSFRERYMASSQLGIPTFDCSMIEMLVDHMDVP